MLKWFVIIVCLLCISCARPLAGFNVVDDNTTFAPSIINFQNQSDNATIFFWDFGDGNTSTEQSPSHQYLLSGRYQVKLTAVKGKKKSVWSEDIIIEAPGTCLVYLETTLGNMLIELYDNAPKHRDNFERLSETGYYDGLLFHRVIRNFMVQTGDPESKNAGPERRLGAGGPDYTIPAEPNYSNFHVKGAVAAARFDDEVNPEKNSSGSQFYIVHGRPIDADQLDIIQRQKRIRYPEKVLKDYMDIGGAPQLDMEYTVFGRVIQGEEVIDKIAVQVTDSNDRPQKDIKIIKASVIK
ncbi:MAG: peptidylprolyl isomerase [Saprospiraceae bacterium]|nr:peptidylprolyl isomerase [Saprospiraceae bacterium]